MPPWAWAWLALLMVAFLVALAWGFVHLQAAMQAALDHALGV